MEISLHWLENYLFLANWDGSFFVLFCVAFICLFICLFICQGTNVIVLRAFDPGRQLPPRNSSSSEFPKAPWLLEDTVMLGAEQEREGKKSQNRRREVSMLLL